jgi:hypothetical protein
MNTPTIAVLARIAGALERIATTLETRNNSKPARIRIQQIPVLPEAICEIEEKLRAGLPELKGTTLTMDEIMSVCKIENATRGQRQAMGPILARVGFKQKRTARQRFYVAP